MDDNIIVACDIGSAKICALVAEIADGNDLKIIGFGESKPDGIKKGVIVNLENTVKCIEQAIEAAERMADIEIEGVYSSVSGSHMSSQNNKGAIAISNVNREITEIDVRRVCENAKTIPLQSNRQIINVITNEFTIDDQDGVKNPVGMAGMRLETEAHIVTGSVTSLQNLQKCYDKAGVYLEKMIFSPLASAEGVLTDDEKKLGTILVDIGAGTTDIAVFVQGNVVFSSSLPVGSDHVTKDLAIGLRTTLEEAEKLKISKGSAITQDIAESEKIEVLNAGKDEYNVHSRLHICSIIEARMEEIFGMVREQIYHSGYKDSIKSGVVITGGGALLTNNDKLCAKILEFPVRVGKPLEISGLTEKVKSPAYSTVVGLMKYTFKNYTLEVEEEITGSPFSIIMMKIKNWLGL